MLLIIIGLCCLIYLDRKCHEREYFILLRYMEQHKKQELTKDDIKYVLNVTNEEEEIKNEINKQFIK